jgi:hypothetical protein
MKMKRTTSLLVTASILMAGSLFAGFMFFDQQKDASKTQVEDAQNSLKSVQKNADRIAERKATNDELKTFKLDSELKIKNNEVRIAELRLKLNKQGSVLDEASAKKIDSFEMKNKNLKTRMGDYELTHSDWTKFKHDFNRDLDHLDYALNNIGR